MYKFTAESHLYSDELLCQEKYFYSKVNAREYLENTLKAILDKYEISDEDHYSDYSIESRPYALREGDKCKYALVDSNALMEVELMIKFERFQRKYNERIFLYIKEIKVEDEVSN